MLNISIKKQLIFIQIAVISSAVVIALALMNFSPLERAEQGLLSKFFLMRGPLAPSDRVVVAAIDDESIEEIGGWPWSKNQLGEIIAKLRSYGASAVAIDATFAENPFGEDRKFLSDLQEKRDTVIGYSFYAFREDIPLDMREAASGADSFDILTAQMIASTGMPSADMPSMAGVRFLPKGLRLSSGMLGFVNLFPKNRDKVLSVPLVARYKNIILPSIGLAAAGMYEEFTPLLRKNSKGLLAGITIGKKDVPVNESGWMMLNPRGPKGTYSKIKVSDILMDKADPVLVKDKIVLIGPAFKGPDNFVATPFGDAIPKIEVWANAVDDVLFGKTLVHISHFNIITIGIILVIALLLGFVLPRIRIMTSFFVVCGLAVILLINGYVFFLKAGIWFSVVTPITAVFFVFAVTAVYKMFTEERLRKRLLFSYGGTLRKKVIDEMVAKNIVLPKNGENRHLTVMTLGIRDFEKISQEIPQNKLMDFIKVYLDQAASSLFSEDAYFVRLGNEKITAIFGAPVSNKDHAERACRAALAIRKSISKNRAEWKEKYGMSSLRLMIGIQTGPIVVGEIKIDGRYDFAGTGLPLAMSHAFMDLNRIYKTSTIVGAETAQASRENNTFRPLELVKMRGVKKAFEVYELLGKKGVVTPYIEIYMRAYEAYRAKNYESAVRLADDLLTRLPHDGPTRILRARAKRLMIKPPEDTWNGAFTI